MYTITIDDISITIEPKRIRTLRLSVKPNGAVHVSCPIYCTTDTAISFIQKHLDWVRKQQQKMRLLQANATPQLPILPEEAQRFAWKLDAILKTSTQETGLHINGYKIKLMRTEWGSCNPRKRTLVFNLALARVPDDCIRYVIIHELCHLLQANHSAAFWNEVEKYCPNWHDLRQQLKQFKL